MRYLLLLTALALATASGGAAQGALDDTTAWEPLGDARQQVSALAFSGDCDAPTVWNGERGAGEHVTSVDVSVLGPGIYVVRVEAEESGQPVMASRRFTVVR